MSRSIRVRRFPVLRPVVALSSAAVIALAASACTAAPSDPASSAPASTEVQDGGTLVIGQEQLIDCADWIGSCAGSIWGTYAMQVETIPSAFRYTQSGDTWQPAPTELMASEPTSEASGNGQVLTYKINPDAVWSDGEPITSEDFKYTALEIRDGKDIIDRTGYRLITSVETPDPQTAVVTLKSTYPNWRDLFSGFTGVLPSHILQGKDRGAAMKAGYDWSGGPWLIQDWDQGVSVTLVPNPNYWGDKPKLDKVIFQSVTNTSAEFQAFKSGQVDAIFPSPQLDAIEALKQGIPGTHTLVEDKTANVEAFWINNKVFPFDSPAVRQAFAYAIDRDAIVEHIYGGLGDIETAQTFWPGNRSEFAGDAFSQYTQDFDKVAEIMEGDGWKKNADGVWEKDGREAEFEVAGTSSDARRQLEEQIVQSQAEEAGFKVTIKNVPSLSSYIFEEPFNVAILALVGTDTPDVFASDAGLNFIGADVPELDTLLHSAGAEIDPEKRAEYGVQSDQIIADQVLSLPLDDTPSMLLTSDKVGGPLSINPIEGPFWNLNEWGLAK